MIGVILRIMVNSVTTTILFVMLGLPAADVLAIIMMFDVGMVLQEELIETMLERRKSNIEKKADGSRESARRRSA